MNIALWVVQALLAAAFLMAGGTKLATPIPELLKMGMTFTQHVPELVTRFIGLSEVAGALGLILPMATGKARHLTPIAAGALALVMLLAVLTHVLLGEWGAIVPPLVLGGLSLFVFRGRRDLLRG